MILKHKGEDIHFDAMAETNDKKLIKSLSYKKKWKYLVSIKATISNPIETVKDGIVYKTTKGEYSFFSLTEEYKWVGFQVIGRVISNGKIALQFVNHCEICDMCIHKLKPVKINTGSGGWIEGKEMQQWYEIKIFKLGILISRTTILYELSLGECILIELNKSYHHG